MMKKVLIFLISIIFVVCFSVSLVACGDNGQTQGESKRIIGIDSEKIYIKANFHLKHQQDLIGKYILFEFFSYDKIDKDELQGVDFEITTDSKYSLSADEYEFQDYGLLENEGCYRYRVKIRTFMYWVTDVRINAIILKISGCDYKFKTDISCIYDTYRPVFVKPKTFGFNTLNAGHKAPYGLLICTQYDMTLKSLKFQTEGFEIISCEVETYTAPQTGTSELISEELPVKLEAEKSYQINIEAISPRDCLYYGYDIEIVLEINGVEMTYNNVDEISGDFFFMGSALNALNALD